MDLPPKSAANPPPPPHAGDRTGQMLGGCVVEHCLGSGAMARVYRARRSVDGLPVAIKVLAPDAASDGDFLARFRREAELCARLSHPNIVRVYGHGCQDGCHFLLLELVEGPSLEDVLDRDGPLPWRQATELFLQLGQALDHLGKHGVIHRDIKPGNMVLTAGGVVKLIDLGFAKRLQSDSDAPLEQTMAGVALGSPAYMPPEQVLDAKSATHTADIYGLGASLFHAVTGRPPFQANTGHATMRQVLYDPHPSARSLVPGIPVALSALIDWTLEKEPGRRPESAAALVRELQNVLYNPDQVSRIRTQRLRQRHLWIWIPVAMSAVAILAMAAWCLLRR